MVYIMKKETLFGILIEYFGKHKTALYPRANRVYYSPVAETLLTLSLKSKACMIRVNTYYLIITVGRIAPLDYSQDLCLKSHATDNHNKRF